MLERRTLLAGGSGILAAVVAGDALAMDERNHAMAMPMQVPMKNCIDTCWASHVMCLQTASSLIDAGYRGQLAAMLSDCAEICQATANSMIRGSVLHAVLCNACAEACERCAAECGKDSGDNGLARCAETCRECAKACRQMAAMTP